MSDRVADRKPGPEPAPALSIIIPTYSRPTRLSACLTAISALEWDDAFEVVVVNDGGQDPLEPLLAHFQTCLNLQSVCCPHSGPAAARNRGSAIARGVLLVFLDDDCIPTARWLSAFAREHDRCPEHMLGGAVANGLSQNPYSLVSDQIVAYTRAFYQRLAGNAPFFPTSNVAVPARNFREVGGFCETIPSATAEDKEFCQRWRKAGYKTSFVDDALVHHYHELSLSGFLHQQYNYGRGIGFVRNAQTGGARRYAPEPLSFYLGLLTAALRSDGDLATKIRNSALLFCSQLMVFAGVLKTIIESRSRAGKQEPATVGQKAGPKIS